MNEMKRTRHNTRATLAILAAAVIAWTQQDEMTPEVQTDGSFSWVALEDSLRSDSIRTANQGPQPVKIKVVKRRFNYRRQVTVALFTMAFIGLIITTAQNWNPE